MYKVHQISSNIIRPKQSHTYLILTQSVDRANLNKSEWLVTNTAGVSK